MMPTMSAIAIQRTHPCSGATLAAWCAADLNGNGVGEAGEEVVRDLGAAPSMRREPICAILPPTCAFTV